MRRHMSTILLALLMAAITAGMLIWGLTSPQDNATVCDLAVATSCP